MKKSFKGYAGLDYVTVVAHFKKTEKHGDKMLADPKDIEQSIATELVSERVPIRGLELRLIKSALELGLDQLAKELDISKPTLIKWIKAEDQRLSKTYEMIVRVLVSDKFGLGLNGTIEDLRADDQVKKIKIDAA